MPSDTTGEGPGSLADSLVSLAGVPYCGDLDGRTRPARLFRAALTALIADRGGVEAMSNGELLVARRAAGAATLCDCIESRIVAGEELKPDRVASYLAASNAFRRLVVTLGLERAQRDVTPRLRDILRADAQ